MSLTTQKKFADMTPVVSEVSAGMESALEQLRDTGNIDESAVERFLKRKDQLRSRSTDFFIKAIMDLSAPFDTSCLTLIPDLREFEIPETKGVKKIQVTGVVGDFRVTDWSCGYLRLSPYSKRQGKPTPATTGSAFKVIKDATLDEIFGGFDVGLDRLCWEEEQILYLSKKLRGNLFATTYLLMRVMSGCYALLTFNEYGCPTYLQLEVSAYLGKRLISHHSAAQVLIPSL